jgi:hypothetical protein
MSASAVRCTTTQALHLHGLSKSGKSNPAASNVKYSVVAGHEDCPQGPAREILLFPNGTEASSGTFILFNIFELHQGKFPTTDVEGNGRKISVARDGIQSILEKLGTGNSCIEISNIVGITNNKGSSLEENVSQVVRWE